MMERSNQLLLIILMTALIAFVVASGTVSVFNVGYSPRGSFDFVNANECTKDGICEVNRLSAEDHSIFWRNLFVGEPVGAFPENSSGNLWVGDKLCVGGDCFDTWGRDCRVFTHSGGTGQGTCQNNGYDFCMAADYERTTTYYDSNGTSCSGEIQVKMVDTYMGTCPGQGGSSGGGCGFNSQGVEPYYGDISFGSAGSAKRVVCCR